MSATRTERIGAKERVGVSVQVVSNTSGRTKALGERGEEEEERGEEREWWWFVCDVEHAERWECSGRRSNGEEGAGCRRAAAS